MSKYTKLLFTLEKRLLKNKIFVLLLILVPAIVMSITTLEKQTSSKSTVGLYFEDDFSNLFLEDFYNNSSVIDFKQYVDKEEMLLDIKKEKIDCGFVFREEIENSLIKNKWNSKIDVYKHKNSQLENMSKENIASRIFEIHSNKTFFSYINKSFKGSYVSDIKELYNNRLTDNSTFSLLFKNKPNDVSYNEEAPIISLNIKGILGLLILVSGFNALLINKDDEESKRFVRYTCPSAITLCNILSSIIPLSLVSYVSILISTSHKGVLVEAISLVVYLGIVTAYCFVFNKILKRKESVAISIPILLFLCIVCSPIVIDMSSYLEVFKIIKYIFPTTYFM